MKDKTINIVLVLIILFIGISYFSIKNYIFKKDSIMDSVKAIESFAENEEWDKAEEKGEEMKSIWQSQRSLVFINYAEGDYSNFEHSLRSVLGGIKAKDEATVFAHANIMKDLWKNFNQVVPEP